MVLSRCSNGAACRLKSQGNRYAMTRRTDMPDEMDAGRPGMARLPGFDEQSDRGQYRDGYGPYGPSVPARGYPPRDYARDRGVRSTRRTSTWTAAALIAAVAATTGYLAHSMPSTSAGSGY